jgi:hypothetical protein
MFRPRVARSSQELFAPNLSIAPRICLTSNGRNPRIGERRYDWVKELLLVQEILIPVMRMTSISTRVLTKKPTATTQR